MSTTTTTKWTHGEAIDLINRLWDGVKAHGYFIALTGSVLTKYHSANDLDLVLYPQDDPHTDYRPALDYLKRAVPLLTIAPVERDKPPESYKLVFAVTPADGRRIELFFPNFTFAGRLDTLTPVKGSGSSGEK